MIRTFHGCFESTFVSSFSGGLIGLWFQWTMHNSWICQEDFEAVSNLLDLGCLELCGYVDDFIAFHAFQKRWNHATIDIHRVYWS